MTYKEFLKSKQLKTIEAEYAKEQEKEDAERREEGSPCGECDRMYTKDCGYCERSEE